MGLRYRHSCRSVDDLMLHQLARLLKISMQASCNTTKRGYSHWYKLTLGPLIRLKLLMFCGFYALLAWWYEYWLAKAASELNFAKRYTMIENNTYIIKNYHMHILKSTYNHKLVFKPWNRRPENKTV